MIKSKDWCKLNHVVHAWKEGPLLTTNPPIEQRVCINCGDVQHKRPSCWQSPEESAGLKTLISTTLLRWRSYGAQANLEQGFIDTTGGLIWVPVNVVADNTPLPVTPEPEEADEKPSDGTV